jgi:preprotein translocase subunit YajC
MFSWLESNAWAMGNGGGAAGAPGGSGGGFMQVLPLVVMFAIFYFLLIRPQQKKAKEHQAMLKAIARGDEVVSSGGLVGRVTKVAEDHFMVEIAANVVVRLERQAVVTVKGKGEEPKS